MQELDPGRGYAAGTKKSSHVGGSSCASAPRSAALDQRSCSLNAPQTSETQLEAVPELGVRQEQHLSRCYCPKTWPLNSSKSTASDSRRHKGHLAHPSDCSSVATSDSQKCPSCCWVSRTRSWHSMQYVRWPQWMNTTSAGLSKQQTQSVTASALPQAAVTSLFFARRRALTFSSSSPSPMAAVMQTLVTIATSIIKSPEEVRWRDPSTAPSREQEAPRAAFTAYAMMLASTVERSLGVLRSS
mmetsp:Transcript_48606/g.128900  ORF Transcript_48606/g.128900 Transcript_48606/m.128900 type:complete len:243 (-) Transcript_48606:261-989(-)